MPFMEWSASISVNVVKFDDQHKRLVAMINALYDEIQAGQGAEVLAMVQQSLMEYTATHFGEEEKMLMVKGYPDLTAHKAEHLKFVQKLLELRSEFASGDANVARELLGFLRNWLLHHIQVENKKYSAFLNSKGVF